MKKNVLILAALLVFLAGCAADDCSSRNVAEQPAVQVSDNYTYIPLNLEGSVGENTNPIGNAILQWEMRNPDRKIVSVAPIYRNSSYGFSYVDKVDGLSIYSIKNP